MTVLEDWLSSETWADVATLALFLMAAVVTYALIRVLLPVASRAARRSKWSWDDIILDKKLKHRLALLGPALIVFLGARLTVDASDWWTEALLRTTAAVIVALAAATVSAVLHAANTVYERKPVSRDRPIEAYIQIAQIIVYLFGAVFVIAVLANQPPWFFVGGLGALTAVLLLIFRDTILSVVASIQLAQADLIDVGDWIEVPEYEADGNVIDVALHTITVRNFDNTTTTIPTYQLVNNPFRNWRGMAESGRRRIKRKILIDVSTIRFLTDDEVERYAQFGPLREYVSHRLEQLALDRDSADAEHGFSDDPRRLTNIGALRAYLVSYLRRMETIDTDGLTFLVRQLEPGPNGLPLEIYAFANTTEWARYEHIQADIFDHILATIPQFGLRVFQEPTGEDVRVDATPEIRQTRLGS